MLIGKCRDRTTCRTGRVVASADESTYLTCYVQDSGWCTGRVTIICRHTTHWSRVKVTRISIHPAREFGITVGTLAVHSREKTVGWGDDA